MRKKFIIFKLSPVVLFITLVLSCQQDSEPPQATRHQNAAIGRAQAWFENHYSGIMQTKSAKAVDVNQLNVNWESAMVTYNDKYEIVETFVQQKIQRSYAAKENYEAYKSTGKQEYIDAQVKLVLLTDQKSGETQGYTMSLNGSKNYLEQRNFDMKANSYQYKTNDFEGIVMFHDLEGNFMNGWMYADGKITHTIGRKKDESDNSAIRTKSAGQTCYFIEIFEIICYWDNWWDPDPRKHKKYCTQERIDAYYSCHYDDNTGSGGGGGGVDPQPGDNYAGNPCYTLNEKAGKNDFFKRILTTVKNMTVANNAEAGSYFYVDNGIDYISEGVTVQQNGQYEFRIKSGHKVNGMMHGHNEGAGTIFSFDDLTAIVVTDMEGKINDYNDFFFGVNTVDGNNSYMLVIDDVNKYQTWKNNTFPPTMTMLEKEDKLRIIEESYDLKSTDSDKNEREFLRYLQENNTGFKMFKNTNSDYSQWKERKLNSNNTIQTVNCN